MEYPEKLKFTEVEETALLHMLSTPSLSAYIDELSYIISNMDMEDFKDKGHAEKYIKGELTTEFETVSTLTAELDFEETVALKLKLEERNKFRASNTAEIETVVIKAEGFKHVCSLTETITLGDHYFRASLGKVFRGSGWEDSDWKVVNSTDPAIVPHL